MPAVHVVGVSALLEWNSSSAANLDAAADAIVALTVGSNATGVMVDYEVSATVWKSWGPTKTAAVATGYARWANTLASKMHAARKWVGVDLSGDCGGSPIDLFAVFGAHATAVDQLMLMGTYRDIHDQLKYEKVLVSRALAAGIRPAQLSVGLGSVTTNRTAAGYGWNATDLDTYLRWLGSLQITNVGVWRADIDVYKGASETAPFFLAALGDFIGGHSVSS
jgi:hypothetical protein